MASPPLPDLPEDSAAEKSRPLMGVMFWGVIACGFLYWRFKKSGWL